MQPQTLLFVMLFLAFRPGSAAVEWNPALWNKNVLYTAYNVPGRFFKPPSDDGGAFEPPAVPLIGYSVLTQCQSPKAKVDYTTAAAGACSYAPNADGTYTYREKQQGERVRLSNCYCYAVDKFMGGWCYPGLGGGAGELVQDKMTCGMLSKRVIADGGVAVNRATALSSQPAQGHYIALMYRSAAGCQGQSQCNQDFHLLRKDSNNLWSQKVGESPVSNLDRAGKTITDPEVVAKDGGYDQFCGYFLVVPAKMKIGTVNIPDGVKVGLGRWTAKQLKWGKSDLPYNANVDGKDYYAMMEAQYALQRGNQQQQQQQQGGDVNQQQQQVNTSNQQQQQPAKPVKLMAGSSAQKPAGDDKVVAAQKPKQQPKQQQKPKQQQQQQQQQQKTTGTKPVLKVQAVGKPVAKVQASPKPCGRKILLHGL